MNCFTDQQERLQEGFILLADDDIDDRLLMDEFFLMNGYRCRMLDSGMKVLEFLASVSADAYPAVVLLDYSMPVLNGEDVLSLIKTSDRLKHLPVLIYSSQMDEQLKAHLLAIGATACFSKTPVKEEWDKLSGTIGSLLKTAC